jgi:two-component system, chemotaxis family, sensor kinase CheA
MATGELQFDLSADDQALFLAEIDEILERLEASLVELERSPDDQPLLNEIFRAAHTIKGNSATIAHTRMTALTHAMETRLDDVRKGTSSVTPQLIEALLKAVDVLKLLRDEVETHVPADVDVDAAASAVERRARLRAAAPMPRIAELGAATSAERASTPSELLASATHRFTMVLEQGPWAAVRALQALMALGEHGRIVLSDPTQAHIEANDAQVGTTLVVTVESEASEQTQLDALRTVPEIASIAVETFGSPDPTQIATNFRERAMLSAEPTQPSASPTVASRATAKTIRIDVAHLDDLLNLVGELVIDRTRLAQLGSSLVDQFGDHRILADLLQTALHIGRITDELQDQVMKSRMLPVETVFNRLPRVVRDLCSKQGKQVEFIVAGKDTELDRSVIEEIGDPLLHLIRNALDHGIETPEKRLSVGKPAVARLRLTARHADSFIMISLEDDGNGIDLDAVKRKAVERGVMSQEYADRASEEEVIDLIFAPGLSTAESVSDLSGRGVGMDVVRANVERINGTVEVQTRRGQGTMFTIRLPLTLAIVQALLVRVAGGIYALPIHAVTETLRIEPHQVHRINSREAIQLRETVLPLVPLRQVFGIELDDEPEEVASDGSRLVVAVHTSTRQVGLIVEGLVGEQEVVIKPLGHLVGGVPGVSGAAILGDGSVALIVDVPALIAQAIRDSTTVAAQPLPIASLAHAA